MSLREFGSPHGNGKDVRRDVRDVGTVIGAQGRTLDSSRTWKLERPLEEVLNDNTLARHVPKDWTVVPDKADILDSLAAQLRSRCEDGAGPTKKQDFGELPGAPAGQRRVFDYDRHITAAHKGDMTGRTTRYGPLGTTIWERTDSGHSRDGNPSTKYTPERLVGRVGSARETRPFIDVPSPVDAAEGLAYSGCTAVACHLIEALADLIHPGAGRVIHMLRTALKVGKGLAKGNGISLTMDIPIRDGVLPAGISIDCAARLGARRDVAPVGIDPSWDPLANAPTAEAKPEFGVGEGVGADHKASDRSQPLGGDAQVFAPQRDALPPDVQVRAVLDQPPTPPDHGKDPPRRAAGLAIVAPIRTVANGRGVFSAGEVVAYAQHLRIVEADDTDLMWYLRGNLLARRRRVTTIVYIDPDSEFGAVIDLSSGLLPSLICIRAAEAT